MEQLNSYVINNAYLYYDLYKKEYLTARHIFDILSLNNLYSTNIKTIKEQGINKSHLFYKEEALIARELLIFQKNNIKLFLFRKGKNVIEDVYNEEICNIFRIKLLLNLLEKSYEDIYSNAHYNQLILEKYNNLYNDLKYNYSNELKIENDKAVEKLTEAKSMKKKFIR